MVQAEEAEVTTGRLKIFLGYASGVGKSYRMFDEARRRKERGQDVVIGAVQPTVPPEVEVIASRLETVPARIVAGEAVMDVETILRRHPAVCVIDGLAYDNPSGSRNATRWQDVADLLAAGISVISSVNIQYVAELKEHVSEITGKQVQQTVPVSFLESAAEIEIVDAPANDQPADLGRAHQLSKLREIALVLAADVVDHQLTDYLQRHGIDQHFSTHERILVCITPRANATEMLETGRIVAERFHGELIVAYVRQNQISATDQAALDAKLDAARAAGARIEILEGDDPVEAILEFAKTRGITQLFIGHSQRSGVWSRMWGNPVDRLIRRSCGMDIRVFPQ